MRRGVLAALFTAPFAMGMTPVLLPVHLHPRNDGLMLTGLSPFPGGALLLGERDETFSA